jgi:hypothetical protein
VLLVVVVAVGGGIAAFLLVRDDGSKAGGNTGGSTAPSAKQAAVKAVVPFDPLGDGTEDNADAHNVVDGSTATVWATDQYNQFPDGPKNGVGLALSLDGEFDVRTVKVQAQQSGWGASIYVSNEDATSMRSLADWGPVRARGDGLPMSYTFDTGGAGVKGRSVLVWFSQLPAGKEGKHYVEVSEVTVG